MAFACGFGAIVEDMAKVAAAAAAVDFGAFGKQGIVVFGLDRVW
jgi:hypothetical protein